MMTKKEIRTAIMWAENKLTHAQVCRELKVTGNTAYSKLARSLKNLYATEK